MQLRLLRHGEVDSTSERAFAAIAAGTARHGDVHVASSQTAGRGRLGRRWSSPPDAGVYSSLVLLPPPPPWNAAALTIAAGLAAYDAARSLGVGTARLKWPNDLCAGNAKLAGVLVETRGLDPLKPHYVVGVGLNVAQRAFPKELLAEREVASLATLGLEIPLEDALAAVLEALARRLERVPERHATLAADFLRASELAGARVRARVGEEELEGEIETLTIERGVALRMRGGGERRFPLEVVRRLSPSL